jgi:hypothetical protein
MSTVLAEVGELSKNTILKSQQCPFSSMAIKPVVQKGSSKDCSYFQLLDCGLQFVSSFSLLLTSSPLSSSSDC